MQFPGAAWRQLASTYEITPTGKLRVATPRQKGNDNDRPIVMIAGADLTESGIVSSLERPPGGNLTGLTSVSTALNGKRLELARGAKVIE